MWPLNLNVEKCPVTSLHLFSKTQSADRHTERQTDTQKYTMRGSVSVLNSIRRQEDKFHGKFAESL